MLLFVDHRPASTFSPEVEGFLQAISMQLRDSYPQGCVDNHCVVDCLLSPVVKVLTKLTSEQSHQASRAAGLLVESFFTLKISDLEGQRLDCRL